MSEVNNNRSPPRYIIIGHVKRICFYILCPYVVQLGTCTQVIIVHVTFIIYLWIHLLVFSYYSSAQPNEHILITSSRFSMYLDHDPLTRKIISTTQLANYQNLVFVYINVERLKSLYFVNTFGRCWMSTCPVVGMNVMQTFYSC